MGEQFDKILVVAAHPDDELLGVGGTIKRITQNNGIANALILAEGQTSRKKNRAETTQDVIDSLRNNSKEAAKILGYSDIEFCDYPDNRMDELDRLDIIKCISEYIEKYIPDIIFTHHIGDLNVDHRRVCEAVLTACRPVGDYCVKRIYSFETPSSTEWNYSSENRFRPNVYFDITDTLDYKLKAIMCYKSELRDYPHPRSIGALRALAGYRGSNVGFKYAEAFELLREVN